MRVAFLVASTAVLLSAMSPPASKAPPVHATRGGIHAPVQPSPEDREPSAADIARARAAPLNRAQLDRAAAIVNGPVSQPHPNVTAGQVRCMQRVYRRVMAMVHDYSLAFGTACGLCGVSC